MPVGVISQDQTTVNVVATQPITQLFAVRELVKIAQADENIARTKAGMPVTTITRQVEKDFFDLLVAERELAAAASDARKIAAPASSSTLPNRRIGVRKRNSRPRSVSSSSF